MRRRIFIQNLSLAGLSAVLLPFPLGCSIEKLTIDSLLGKDIYKLNNYKIEGNENFSYISLTGDEFDTEFKSNKTIIFIENQKIVGYTLTLEKNIFKLLENKYGLSKLEIDNHFGKKWIWKTESIVRSLTVVQKNSIILYSNYLPDNNLIVF